MILFLRSLLPIVLVAASAQAAVEHQVDVRDFQFQPAQLQIEVGDTVIWNVAQGLHNVLADDGSFTSGPPRAAPWTFSQVFDQPGEYRYFCVPHGAAGGVGMSGRIVVVAADPEPAFRINEGLNGAWFNPDTAGQGWLFDFAPALDQFFFAAWFTWDLDGGQHDWFTAQGRYDGNRAVGPLVRTRGGRFDAGDPVTVEAAGEVEIEFESCTRAQLQYRVDETGEEGLIPLQRITPVPARCEEAQDE